MPGYWQSLGDEIDVATWPVDEEYPLYPEGSRDKMLLLCPSPAPQPWLVPGHRYLFKQSRAVYPDQYWAEVVASRLSRLTGVPVPPAYVAWDSRIGICAALIEWFYGYPNTAPQNFLSGGLFMKQLIKDFDHERGTQHNYRSVEALSRALLHDPYMKQWARMLAFDALIGNTDRHQENWGFLIARGQDGQVSDFGLSPAFDNGTSLGHERPPDQFSRFEQPAYLDRYIRRGRHHMKWQMQDAERCGHAELLLKIREKHPQTGDVMLSVLQFDPADLQDAVMSMCDIVVPVRLTPERARFMLRLLEARRTLLVDRLSHP